MSQTAFAYDAANASAVVEPIGVEPIGLPLTISIFADRQHLRAQMHEDAAAAGFRVTADAGLDAIADGPARPLGDIVLVDCPAPGAAEMAALARLDLRAARSGVQLIVATGVAALDGVFACMDQSDPQILVDPSRGERAIALGEARVRIAPARVRELSDEDRLAMLRLTEQVGRIAQRLDRLAPPPAMAAPALAAEVVPASASASSSASAVSAFRFDADQEPADRAVQGELALPDAKVVRRIIRHRQLRARFLDPDLFADPAWDMLLDLTAAMIEKVRVSVTSLCIAAGVPPTTALRWIRQMTEAGVLRRIEDETDRRRAFIVLTPRSSEAMSAYFAALGKTAELAL